MNTDQERWRRVTQLFHAALERPAAERDAFLAVACGGDAALAAEVRSLLANHDRASGAGLLESPAFENDPELLDDPGESLAGRTVGPYHIERVIARGGMGVVYLARDTSLGRVVALKALPATYAADGSRRARLRLEARAAAKLAHPAVATVYRLEEIEGLVFIVSEYIDGHSLRDEIRHGPLEAGATLATARAVASALAAAHARGIVHRDLKPENVMRARDGAIKVLDFGLARVIDPEGPTNTRLTAEGAIVGTPGYMPPEQVSGLPVDERADVYSFGVLLHELATGRLPGSGTPGPLTAHLDFIIRKCLALNPADRFQNGAAIVAALEMERAGAGPSAAAAPRSALWWWQFHQLAIAALHASLLAGVWFARGWLDRPWRSLAFYGAIVAATSDVTMRLNLWFASRVQPGALASQRARLARAILAADAAYALVLCALAAAGAGAHDELAALLVGGAIVSLLSVLLIEPATSRAAFGRSPRATPRGPRGRQPPTPRRAGPRPSSR
ncbi:MAG: serine/threonine-protein kinase [Vicinamibacterales bacterium]